jgi:hypothetical protein
MNRRAARAGALATLAVVSWLGCGGGDVLPAEGGRSDVDDATNPDGSASSSPDSAHVANGDADVSLRPDAGPTSDAGSRVDASDGKASDANACRYIANTAGFAPVRDVDGPPPAFVGGPISDGLYTLTAITVYAPGSAPPLPVPARSSTLLIQQNGFSLTETTSGATEEKTSGALSTSSNSLALDAYCPEAYKRSTPYVASSTTIQLDGAALGYPSFPGLITIVLLYERR